MNVFFMFFFGKGKVFIGRFWEVVFCVLFPCNCITVTFECLLVRCSSLTIIIPSVIC